MIDRYELLDETVEAIAYQLSQSRRRILIGDPLGALVVWRYGRPAYEEISGRYERFLISDEPPAGPDYRSRRRLWILGLRERDMQLGELLGILPEYAAGFDRGYVLSLDTSYPRRRGELYYEPDYADGLFDAVALEGRLRRERLITTGGI